MIFTNNTVAIKGRENYNSSRQGVQKMLLKNVLFIVEDIEKSRRFYENVLGLKIMSDLGKKLMFAGGLVLEERTYWENALHILVGFGGRDAELYFEDADVGALRKKLEESEFEVEFLEGVGEREGDVVRFYDPDRHVIEVRKV